MAESNPPPAALVAENVVAIERQPYPAPYDTALTGKSRRPLGEALGLTLFGVNLTELQPGAQSALRHWHSAEDEFVYVVEGEVTLVTDDGEQVLGPGSCAGFPAGRADGHHLVNRGSSRARYIEVGNRAPGDEVIYPDDDLILTKDEAMNRAFLHRDRTPY